MVLKTGHLSAGKTAVNGFGNMGMELGTIHGRGLPGSSIK
jgi:hypothetical protein